MWETGQNIVVRLRPDLCQTVLVLGAGASAHLGFPLGPELCSKIIDNTSDSNASSFKELCEMRFPNESISSFHDQLNKSYPHSIDEFLSDRPEFIDVGRAAIGQVVIACEDEKRLRRRDDNWYGLLRNRIKADIERNECRPIIVTFNYDLSLEKFLYDFAASTFPRYASINSLKDVVRILHVHGRLGYLDYEVTNSPRRSYGGHHSPSEILAASQGIRVPSQLDSDHGKNMLTAQEAIKQAKCVIFLGFGYDDMNLERLRVGMYEPGKYFGTAYGLESPRNHDLSDMGISLGDRGLRISDYLASLTCWTVN